eukprot:Sspe_Gene.30890::Locus_15260_Transcript_1_1_Confidence_1.000_Length_857::g.30890::m.30890
MGGEGPVWTSSRPPDSRTRSHAKAWRCPKREAEKIGRRFKLDDCRTWMRLMFWSFRESGLARNAAFFNWYVQFIAHFIAIYEFSAPPYALADANWSANPENIDAYIAAGNRMPDL